jgi:deoxyribose-phosphate aldolase
MINPGTFKSGRFEAVLGDQEAFVWAAEILRTAGADFVQISTRFTVGRATLYDEVFLEEAVGPWVAL